jgi:alkyl hydroperoxide reductase subunit AhpF
VTGGAGQGRLESLTLADLDSGTAETVDAVALFVLIGAEPRTQWMPDAVRRDQPGFVVTGTDVGIVWRCQMTVSHHEWQRIVVVRSARPVVAQVCGLGYRRAAPRPCCPD